MDDPAARLEIANVVRDMDTYDSVIVEFHIWRGNSLRIIETKGE